MAKNELPAHLKIFSTVVTLFGVGLVSPLGLIIQQNLLRSNAWIISSILAILGIAVVLLNIIHASWYIEKRKEMNV